MQYSATELGLQLNLEVAGLGSGDSWEWQPQIENTSEK